MAFYLIIIPDKFIVYMPYGTYLTYLTYLLTPTGKLLQQVYKPPHPTAQVCRSVLSNP